MTKKQLGEINVMKMPCPVCDAPPGKPCRIPGRRRLLSEPHSERVRLAVSIWEKSQ